MSNEHHPDSNSPNPNSGDFWGANPPADPSKPLADPANPAPATWTSTASGPKPAPGKRRTLRWVLLGGGATLVGLIALGPSIAGWLAPSIAPGFVPVNGKVTVESASFGWFSSQTLGTTTILDAKGQEVARFKATIDAGLLPLLFGGRDLGLVKVDGSATITQAADGTTNLDTLLPKPASAPATPAKPSAAPRLPSGLAVKLQGNFKVTYVNQADPSKSCTLKDIVVNADVAAGKPLTATVTAKAEQASGTGDVKLTLTADDWSTADGALLIDPAKPFAADKPRADLTVEVANFPAALLDAFAPPTLSLRKALGESLALAVTFKGGMKQADTAVRFTAPNARATAAFEMKDGALRSTAPAELFIAGPALAGLSPHAADLLRPPAANPSAVQLDALPDVDVRATDIAATLPTSGAPDLRGVAATITVKTTPIKGSAAVAEGRRSAFTIDALTSTVRTADLAKGVTLQATTKATLDGAPAGTVDIDLATGSVLDASGRPIKSIPAGLAGKANITGIATAIAQPFVAAFKLDLPQDLGPTLDLRLSATSVAGAAAKDGQLPPADLDLVVVSEKLTANGRFTLAEGALRTRGEGLTASAANASGLASRFLVAAPVTLAPGGRAIMTVRDLNVPLGAGNAPKLDQAVATIGLAAANWSVAPAAGATVASNAPPVEVRDFTTTITLAPNQPIAVTARGAMSHANQPFTLAADLKAPGVLTADPARPIDTAAALRAIVALELKDLPTALVALAPLAPASTDPKAPGTMTAADLVALAESAIGRSLTVKLATAPATDKSAATTLTASATAERLTASVAGSLTETALAFTTIAAESTLTPELQRTVMDRLLPPTPTPANGQAALPMLTRDATVKVVVDPLTIPMKGLAPDFAAAQGDAAATITLPGAVLVRTPAPTPTPTPAPAVPAPAVPAPAGQAPVGVLGVVGVRDLTAKVRLPLAVAMGAAGRRGALAVTVTGQAVRERAGAAADVGTLAASIDGEVADLRPASALRVALSVRALATAFLDELAGRPGFVTGALGDTASLETRLALTPNAGAGWGELASGAIAAEVGLVSPRLTTTKPIKADVLADRLTLREPAAFAWTLDPAFFNLLTTPTPTTPRGTPGPALLTLTKPTTFNVALRTLALSKAPAAGGAGGAGVAGGGGGGGGPFKPGIFDLSLLVSSPGLAMTAKDGAATTLTGLSITATRVETGVAFNLALDEAQAGGGAPAKGVKLAGAVANLADAQGNLTPDALTVTALGDLPAVPTIVLDTLAAQNGLLVEALGPVTTIKVDARQFGRSGGTLAATASSARASFDLAGAVTEQVLVNAPDRPLKVNITEITQDLSKRLVKGLPLFGSVRKSPTDRPASVTGANLRVPLTSDLSKLDGDFTIDPGEINFEIAGDFAEIVAAPLLNAAKANTSGKAGARLQPMTVSIRSGVASLTRWSVPIGEFTVQMDGTVNLATGEVNFVTYLPAGAIALEKLKLPGPVGAIGADLLRNAVIPVRTRGTTTARQTQVDGDAAAKELFKGLDPGKLIDLLKPKPKPPAPQNPR